MKNNFYRITVFLFILFSSCATLNNSTRQELLFELETTSCYGTCPVYKLQVFTNGSVLLTGKQHLDKIGEYKAKINKENLNSIITSFEQKSFFNFQDYYTSRFLDLPTKYVSYHKNGEIKRIMAYDNIPKELNYLITILENLVDELDWEKVK